MQDGMAWVDEHMPAYRFRSELHRRTAVDARRVTGALLHVEPSQMRLSAVLFALRAIPLALSGRPVSLRTTVVEAMLRLGFLLLEAGDDRLALGLAGRFWTPTGGLIPLPDRAAFTSFAEPGAAKAMVAFAAVSAREVCTETRVQTFGSADRRFRGYWRLIKLGSQLTRWEWLRAAERLARR